MSRCDMPNGNQVSDRPQETPTGHPVSKFQHDANLADPSCRQTKNNSEIVLPSGFPSAEELRQIHKPYEAQLRAEAEARRRQDEIREKEQDAKQLEEAKKVIANLPEQLKLAAKEQTSMDVFPTTASTQGYHDEEPEPPAYSSLRPGERYVWDALTKANLAPSISLSDGGPWTIRANWRGT